jgi:hypothetical protein
MFKNILYAVTTGETTDYANRYSIKLGIQITSFIEEETIFGFYNYDGIMDEQNRRIAIEETINKTAYFGDYEKALMLVLPPIYIKNGEHTVRSGHFYRETIFHKFNKSIAKYFTEIR